MKTKEAGQRQVDILQRKANAGKEDSNVYIHNTGIVSQQVPGASHQLESQEIDQLRTMLRYKGKPNFQPGKQWQPQQQESQKPWNQQQAKCKNCGLEHQAGN